MGQVEEPATVGHDLEAAEQQELAAADISGAFRLAIYRYLAKADVPAPVLQGNSSSCLTVIRAAWVMAPDSHFFFLRCFDG